MRRRVAWVGVVIGLVIALAGPVGAWASGGRAEVPGNPGNLPSWSFRSYMAERGRGPNLTDHAPVVISCRIRGTAVSDGDVWWYRIASKPWDNRYYASADDFYNNGRTRGSLHGTPYFDPQVPVC